MAYTTIDDPSAYFQTTLYAGDGGASGQAITHGGNSDLQADWIWIKNRTDAENHSVTDSVRGGGKGVLSNSSDAESNNNSNGYLSSFNSDGFTTANAGVYNNANAKNYVSWNWKAGTSFTNDASGTGIGSIDSAGSVSTTAGFSIVSYTGSGSSATIAHALGSKPDIIFTKQRDDNSAAWGGYVSALGATKDIGLSTSGAADADTSYWGDTEPTSTVFTVSSNARSNASGEAYIAYCFTNIKGYSKIGSYTGNGNADGTFVYTGFKPAFLIIKRTTAADTWHLVDNKRDPYNMVEQNISPDTSAVANPNAIDFDFLSNGFKLRNNDNNGNNSGDTYIYMCFAENPFVTSTGVPATAR